jgi:hypothetical protein
VGRFTGLRDGSEGIIHAVTWQIEPVARPPTFSSPAVTVGLFLCPVSTFCLHFQLSLYSLSLKKEGVFGFYCVKKLAFQCGDVA